jgi:hypothetical protein
VPKAAAAPAPEAPIVFKPAPAPRIAQAKPVTAADREREARKNADKIFTF